MEIKIQCNELENEDDFHNTLAEKLSFPSYYGKNLDALWDVMKVYSDKPLMLTFQNSNNLRIIPTVLIVDACIVS